MDVVGVGVDMGFIFFISDLDPYLDGIHFVELYQMWEYFTFTIHVLYDVGFVFLKVRTFEFIHWLYCLGVDEFIGVEYQM